MNRAIIGTCALAAATAASLSASAQTDSYGWLNNESLKTPYGMTSPWGVIFTPTVLATSHPAFAQDVNDYGDFTAQGMAAVVYVLTAIILLGLIIGFAYFVYWVASLPGHIAASRGHPQASAIAICGWMGLITLVLWPVALIWAYTTTEEQRNKQSAVTSSQLESLREALRKTSEQVAALEGVIGAGGERS
jgi:hypothetical protein